MSTLDDLKHQLGKKLRRFEAPDLPGLGSLKPAEKIKLVVSSVVLLICLVAIGWQLAPTLFRGEARALDTKGWNLVHELNAKLHEGGKFLDVGFAVQSERPLKFDLFGGVHSQAELTELNARLKEIRPEGDYELKVELLGK